MVVEQKLLTNHSFRVRGARKAEPPLQAPEDVLHIGQDLSVPVVQFQEEKPQTEEKVSLLGGQDHFFVLEIQLILLPFH